MRSLMILIFFYLSLNSNILDNNVKKKYSNLILNINVGDTKKEIENKINIKLEQIDCFVYLKNNKNKKCYKLKDGDTLFEKFFTFEKGYLYKIDYISKKINSNELFLLSNNFYNQFNNESKFLKSIIINNDKIYTTNYIKNKKNFNKIKNSFNLIIIKNKDILEIRKIKDLKKIIKSKNTINIKEFIVNKVGDKFIIKISFISPISIDNLINNLYNLKTSKLMKENNKFFNTYLIEKQFNEVFN